MGQTVSGGNSGEELKTRTEKLSNKLVIEDVVIVERKKEIEVPEVRYYSVEYEKPIIREKEYTVTKYNTVELPTTKYNTVEEKTVKYIPEEVVCEKPIIKEVEYDKPVYKDVQYERPVINKKEYEILEVKNIDEIKEYTKQVKELAKALGELEAHMGTLKKYTLVEEIIRVPKVEYFPQKVERIVWVDVKRERVVDGNKV